MKIWLVGEQTSKITFNYQELSVNERELIICSLEAAQNVYRQLNEIHTYNEIEEVLRKIRKEN